MLHAGICKLNITVFGIKYVYTHAITLINTSNISLHIPFPAMLFRLRMPYALFLSRFSLNFLHIHTVKDRYDSFILANYSKTMFYEVGD